MGNGVKVLVACEFSCTVRDAFAARGHDAWSWDIIPADRAGQHIQGDVLKHLEGWHRGMIKDWLRDKIPHETPRSACTFCPFHDNAEWQRIKAVPADWDRACQIDDSLRNVAEQWGKLTS